MTELPEEVRKEIEEFRSRSHWVSVDALERIALLAYRAGQEEALEERAEAAEQRVRELEGKSG